MAELEEKVDSSTGENVQPPGWKICAMRKTTARAFKQGNDERAAPQLLGRLRIAWLCPAGQAILPKVPKLAR